MAWLISLGVLISLLFLIPIIRGAPYVPTLRPQITVALDLLALQPGQCLIELGSGDGRVVNLAAARGWRVVGYELNPLLCAWSWIRCWRYRSQVRLHCRDMWNSQLPHAEGVFVFGVERIMGRLSDKLSRELRPGTRVASFAMELPGRTPIKVERGIFLYQF